MTDYMHSIPSNMRLMISATVVTQRLDMFSQSSVMCELISVMTDPSVTKKMFLVQAPETSCYLVEASY